MNRHSPRIALAAAACAIAGALGLVASPAADAAPNCAADRARYCAAAADSLLDVQISDLHPTQPSLGYDEVYARLGRWTFGPNAAELRFDTWCETNGQRGVSSFTAASRISDPASFTCEVPLGSETAADTDEMKTVVIGPGGRLYLTDGHHTLTSFWETIGGGPSTHVRLRVAGNLSDQSPAQFWKTMRDKKWTWLKNTAGASISPAQLPKSLGLGQFGNDTYRAALYFLDDVSFSSPGGTPPFQEFYWGAWLRDRNDAGVNPARFDLRNADSYQRLLRNIGDTMIAASNDEQIAGGFTASELGKRKSFDEKEFAKLITPLTESRPGKLTAAIAYKNSLGLLPQLGSAS
ncbi:ParB/Srx family N-terminal domain-containing protein [Gordonia sp. NPDC003376]